MEERLLSHLQSPEYEPGDVSALSRALCTDVHERPTLRAIIRDWEKSGKLLRVRGARYVLKVPSEDTLTGLVRKGKSGKLLFVADSRGQQIIRRLMPQADSGEIELPVISHRDGGAMDGDTVRVTLRRHAPTGYHRRRDRKQRPEASALRLEVRVDDIMKRRRGTWVGIYRPGGRHGTMEGDGKTAPEQVMLTTPPPPELLVGYTRHNYFYIHTFFGGKTQRTVELIIGNEVRELEIGALERLIGIHTLDRIDLDSTIAEVLGWPDENGADITAIMHRYTLRSEFPPEVLEEVSHIPDELPPEEMERREDWRERCVITIDPATARDYDDAISLRELPGGDVELAVHIADVSYYVRPGSELDREAEQRGNSTYLPDRVLPMLPPRLCDELCSLKSGVDRATRLCVLQINMQGEVTSTRFADAVIRSRARLSYEQALAVIEERSSSGISNVDSMLRLGHQTAARLRRRRMEQGALDLDIPELRVVLDPHGYPIGVETESHDIAHQMIEEFMLAANEAVARGLRQALTPTIYRIHEEPDPAKLHTFALLARAYGISAGSLNTREELSRVVTAIKGHSDEQILTLHLLRAMMRARYSPSPLGHFGLAKGDYCHFTSPIRRYADLIVHRGFDKLTKGRQARTKLPPPARLQEIADHISETERNSAAAEKEARQTKLALYLENECSSEHPKRWCAIVTDSYPQGLAVEIPDLQMRGFISGDELTAISDCRWFYENHASRWSNTEGQYLLPGSRLDVIPIHVDRVSRFVDFAPAPTERKQV